jgi:hypothetical protein
MNHESTDAIAPEQIIEQMNRILASRHLRQARSLEKFLSYVIEKKLAGDEDEVKEYTIGLEVFARGQDYDPRRDAVVRVQASMLRKRLTGYYENEGIADRIVIEIPKGHYIPQFRLIDPVKTSCELASVPINVDKVAINHDRKLSLLSYWPSLLRVAATFILGLLTAIAFQYWGASYMPAAIEHEVDATHRKIMPDEAYLPLWEKFFEPGVENVLAYGTPQFFVANGVYLRDVEINSPRDERATARLISLKKAFHHEFRPTEVYTGVGETHGVYLLTKFFNKTAKELHVTRSRMVGWNELKNTNVIFLSSMRFHTLAKELQYPSDFAINSGKDKSVFNMNPREGEASRYGDSDYAVITLWPGKLPKRSILVLSGATTWATLAAAEYVTDAEYLRRLNHHLDECRIKSGAPKHAPYFQILLRAEVKDNHPVSISYVTHHDLTIRDQR